MIRQPTFTHIRVHWLHSSPDDPIELWSELDTERFEVRKIELWQDGRAGFASREREAGGTMLGLEPAPTLAEIGSDPQFEPEKISELEFENCWRKFVR